MGKKLKKLVDNYGLCNRTQVMDFILENPENLNVDELSRIAELVNTKRSKTAAYYTDPKTLQIIEKHLPKMFLM